MKTFGAGIMAAALLLGVPGAKADPFIIFTDNDPTIGMGAFVGDTSVNWAVRWTQASATSNVTLRAILAPETGASSSGTWYVTNAIGPGVTSANVLASGSFTTTVPNGDIGRYNNMPRTILGTGLNFAAGTYYLVLDGTGSVQSFWAGGANTATTIGLAPGFSIDGYYSTGVPASFAPASGYFNPATDYSYVFEMDGVNGAAVPEPASWALLLVGFGAIGAGLRHRKNRVIARTTFA